MATLGVNIDHVATLRQQRGTRYPDPIEAAVLVQLAGADQLTVHLREDRRHICDRDVRLLRAILQIPLNLEIANTLEMRKIALEVRPHMVTLVPEKREEKTTEGGLHLSAYFDSIRETTALLQEQGMPVSLFIEPNVDDVTLAFQTGARMIELHTGKYSEMELPKDVEQEFVRIEKSTAHAHSLGLIVHAGHGLNYQNTARIARIPHMCDLNIGHSIISRAVLTGLESAVREMKRLIEV